MSEIVIRPARKSECTEIAQLFLISSDGLAEYIWSRETPAGRSPLETGCARYAREGVAFSWQNCLVAVDDDRIVGMLHSFPMTAAGDGAAETDPVLRPYAELEDPGSLYISGIAICDGWRRQGIGTVLLEVATGRAAALALPRISLICFAANDGAMRLYRRLGFREIDRRPIHPHPMLHYGAGDAVLLVRPVDGGVAVGSVPHSCRSAA